MSITISTSPWTTDPSVLGSLFVLAGALGAWALTRLASLLGRSTDPR